MEPDGRHVGDQIRVTSDDSYLREVATQQILFGAVNIDFAPRRERLIVEQARSLLRTDHLRLSSF